MMDKQIEEMAKAIEQARIKATDTTNSMNYGFGGWYAKELYNAGYRKSSDVAREIITEIDNALHDMAMEYHNAGHPEYFAVCEMVYHKVIRPIEKKYTE